MKGLSSFISRLENSESGLQVVKTILSMAHSLGINVIAEGVETIEQLALLKKMKCEFAQGFLFGQPVNSQEAAAQLGRSVLDGGKLRKGCSPLI